MWVKNFSRLNTNACPLSLCFLIMKLSSMNSADLYFCEPAKNGIITYNRQKTKDRRDDNAEMKIKIESCIQALIDKYSQKDDKRLFAFSWLASVFQISV